MSSGPVLAPDAAIVLGIASTAMPFARTPDAEVERWLRLLRLHGQVGSALQALGVSEGALEQPDGRLAPESAASAGTGARAEHDAVERVTEQAVRVAGERGARVIATTDVLIAVMRVYGEDFDRALRAHGSDRHELLEKLSAQR
jgi:hypothetical protein